MIACSKKGLLSTLKRIVNNIYSLPFILSISFIPSLVQCFNALMRGGGGLHSPYYFIGYETGFGGRKLIGSLFSLFLPDYVQHRHIGPIVFMAFLLLAFLFIILVFRTMKLKDLKSSPAAQSTLCFLAIYLFSPIRFLVLLDNVRVSLMFFFICLLLFSYSSMLNIVENGFTIC